MKVIITFLLVIFINQLFADSTITDKQGCNKKLQYPLVAASKVDNMFYLGQNLYKMKQDVGQGAKRYVWGRVSQIEEADNGLPTVQIENLTYCKMDKSPTEILAKFNRYDFIVVSGNIDAGPYCLNNNLDTINCLFVKHCIIETDLTKTLNQCINQKN